VSVNFARLISRLEKQAAEKLEDPLLCTCELMTRYHNARCLEALLKGKSRFCPVHDFRWFRMFFESSPQHPLGGPPQHPLVGESDKFCPCPPHPYRDFQLKRAFFPNREAAMEAWHNHPKEITNFEEERRLVDKLISGYHNEAGQWMKTTGRKLPSLEGLRKIESKRGKNVG
jgi:hypothetical protein